MMRIYDGRTSFYQWDTNQKITSYDLKVGDPIHFYNTKQPTALTVAAYEYEGKIVADVPNILLQNALNIIVYRWVDDGVAACTLEEYTFEVKQRPKPSDYVYTEVDILNYQTLAKRIDNIEENGVTGGGTSNIFIATYGETTNGEIYAAQKAGKTLFARQGSAVWCSNSAALEHTARFGGTINGNFVQVNCINDKWTITRIKMTESITEESTHEEHPTAKAVYDYVSEHSGGAGDDVFWVNATHDPMNNRTTCNQTPDEIYREYEAGKSVLCEINNDGIKILMVPAAIWSTVSIFYAYVPDITMCGLYTLVIREGTVQFKETAIATGENIAETVATIMVQAGVKTESEINEMIDTKLEDFAPDSAGTVYYVTITRTDSGSWQSDKTNAEIFEAYEAGFVIKAKYDVYADGPKIFPLTKCNSTSATFALPNQQAIEQFWIDEVGGAQTVIFMTLAYDTPGSGGNAELDTTLTEEGKAADAKAVGDAISALSDEIAALKGETTTIVPVSEFLYGGYIRADGTLNSATASMSVYGPIVLKAGDKVSFTAAGIANASAILARSNGNADKPYDVVLTPSVSEEAEAFEYEVAVSGDYYISSIRKYATVTECSVTEGQAEDSGNEITTNEVAVSEYLNGGYVRAEGTLNSSTASFSVYGPIALNAGDVVRFTAAGYSTAVAILAVSTGSEDKPYNAVIVSEDGDAHEFVYTVIASGEYYISSVRSKATVSSVLVTTGQTDSKEEVDLSGYRYAVSKVLCIGDSLTNGAYYVGDANGAPITQSYPYYLGRMLNCETTNAGNNGASASDWYNRNISDHTYTNYDTVIIWLGTNYGCTAMPTDAEISSFTPDSNATAENENQALYLIEIIKTIQAENPSCHIVLCTIFASNTDVAANNYAVSQIADKYGCQLVDMSDLSVSNHIELHAGIKNIHFGKVGNIYIANRLANEISAYIGADPLKGEFGITFR